MSTDIINKRLKIIEDLEEELNKIKALYTDSLENTKEFQDIQEEAKKIREQTKDKKAKVMEKPHLKDFQDQMKDLKQELKDNKDVLAQELADYYKDSGSMEFVDSDGVKKRVVFSVKLVDISQ